MSEQAKIIDFAKERDIREITKTLRAFASENYVSSLRERIWQRFHHPEQLPIRSHFEDLPILLTELGRLLEVQESV